MREESIHFVEHLRQQHPVVLIIYLVLVVGIVLAVVLISVPILIYQTIRNRRKSSETIRQAPRTQYSILGDTVKI